MTPEDRDPTRLDPEERRFVEKLGESYRPAPLSATRRAALDARLRERIERPSRRPLLAPGLVMASLVGALVWLGLPANAPEPATGRTVAAVPSGQIATLPSVDEDWEARLFLGSASDTELEEEESGLKLPPEYAAIESVFFDG